MKRWMRFLNEVWPDDVESQELLQEWFGLCLTDDTSFQRALVLVGPSCSGKNTIATVLELLHGDSAAAMRSSFSDFGQPFSRPELHTARVLILNDVPKRLGGRAATQRLVEIVGEDVVLLRSKHIETSAARLKVRITLLTNTLPNLGQALSRVLGERLLVLSLSRSFFGLETPSLVGSLYAEAPGILRWAAEGLERLRARGHFHSGFSLLAIESRARRKRGVTT